MTAIEQSRIARLEKEISTLKKDVGEIKEKLQTAAERLARLQNLKKHASPLQK